MHKVWLTSARTSGLTSVIYFTCCSCSFLVIYMLLQYSFLQYVWCVLRSTSCIVFVFMYTSSSTRKKTRHHDMTPYLTFETKLQNAE